MDAGRADHRRHATATATAVGFLLALLAAPAALALPRATADRPDDLNVVQQVHVIYAVPADGADNSLDTDGTIAGSVASWQAWLRGQTGGPGLTLDTSGGALDITFARLPKPGAEYEAKGLFIRDEIETDLRGMGVLQPRKLYAVYYDGTATGACGGAPWPQSEADVAKTDQQVGAFYLQGKVPGFPDCNANPFAGAGQPPGYKEFAQLHELIHGLGVAPTCAPHHTLSGHVSDSPTDLMYAGGEPWNPQTLDVGRDDYFDANVPGCLDLARSKYLEGNGTPPSSDPTDPAGQAPETDRDGGPTGKIKSRTATFRFSSDTAESFECHLDKAAWKGCESPVKVKKLKRGKHRFYARGIDANGADSTPVVWKFRVAP